MFFLQSLGIDPGKTGALALNSITLTGQPSIHVLSLQEVFCCEYPELYIIRDWLHEHVQSDTTLLICMEAVHAFKDQGVTSTFNFGKVFGMLYGYVHSQMPDAPILLISPLKWRNKILGKGAKGKEAVINHCLNTYDPALLLRTKRSKVPDHNIADALCLAEYGRGLIEQEIDAYLSTGR